MYFRWYARTLYCDHRVTFFVSEHKSRVKVGFDSLIIVSFCFTQPWWLKKGGSHSCGHWPCCACWWTHNVYTASFDDPPTLVLPVKLFSLETIFLLHTRKHLQGISVLICNKMLWIVIYVRWYTENNTCDTGLTFLTYKQMTTDDCGLLNYLIFYFRSNLFFSYYKLERICKAITS